MSIVNKEELVAKMRNGASVEDMAGEIADMLNEVANSIQKEKEEEAKRIAKEKKEKAKEAMMAAKRVNKANEVVEVARQFLKEFYPNVKVEGDFSGKGLVDMMDNWSKFEVMWKDAVKGFAAPKDFVDPMKELKDWVKKIGW